VTPYALFAIAVLAPVAVVVAASTVSRRRRGRVVERWRTAGAIASELFLFSAVLAVAGWALPDALDRLPVSERRAIGPALEATPECGLLPFARVMAVEVRQSPDHGPTLHYTCGVSHLGFPRYANEATCAGGAWRGPGLRDSWSAGSCDEFRTP
jgi:hypothetical protein